MFDIIRYSRIRNRIEKEILKKIVTDWNVHSPEDYYNDPRLARVEKQIFLEEALPCHNFNNAFTSVEERLLPCRGWTGPDGYPGENAQSGYPDTAVGSRTNKKISPQNPFGALIGTFDSPADPSCSIFEIEKFEPRCIPSRQASTFVGGSEFPARGGECSVNELGWKEGERKNLWLIVNHVLDDGHKFPEKFYVDNLGSFYVEVDITHSKQKWSGGAGPAPNSVPMGRLHRAGKVVSLGGEPTGFFLYLPTCPPIRKSDPRGSSVYNIALVRQLCKDIFEEKDAQKTSELASLCRP
jgi:hypothetical protein